MPDLTLVLFAASLASDGGPEACLRESAHALGGFEVETASCRYTQAFDWAGGFLRSQSAEACGPSLVNLAEAAIAAPGRGRQECGPAPQGASSALGSVIRLCNLDQETTRLVVGGEVSGDCAAWPGVGYSLVMAARLEAAAIAEAAGPGALAEEAADAGEDALRAVWLTALHADNTPDVRADYVEAFEALAADGKMAPARYFQIADRHALRVSDGAHQLYGSAWRCEAGEARFSAPIKDLDAAARRRAELGAPTIDHVLSEASSQCGTPG